MPATYEPIASTTVGTPALNVTFSNIPSTYTDLVMVCSYARSGAGNAIALRLNGDSGNNYSETYMENWSTNTVSGRNINQNLMFMAFIQNGTGTQQANLILHFQNYASTAINKTVLCRYNEAGTSGGVGASVGLWRSTNAINEITIGYSATLNWVSGSVLTLYGIKAA